MADSGINVTWDDHDAVAKAERLAIALSDLRPFWPLVVPVFIYWMAEQFRSEGHFAGSGWAPLTPAYAAWKATKYPGRGILYATGDLRQAASRPRRNATATELVLTVDDSDKLHGGKTARAVLPYHEGDGRVDRPLLFGEPLPYQAQTMLQEVADRYADELVRNLRLI